MSSARTACLVLPIVLSFSVCEGEKIRFVNKCGIFSFLKDYIEVWPFFQLVHSMQNGGDSP
jgi:hypothetical protein